MSKWKSLALFGALAASLAFAAIETPAQATDANAFSRVTSDPFTVNMYLGGAVQADLSTPYTNSTTGYTDVTGATVAIKAWPGDIGGGASSYPQQLWFVCYAIDGSKATSTSGTVGIFVNGALDADTVQTGTFAAGHISVGGCYSIPNTLATAQTIKLQAKSGDTAAFTINQASLTVFRVR